MVRAALLSGLDRRDNERFIAEMGVLARQEAGLALRLAMVLACIKRFDVAEIGYSGFMSFCRERVDWGQSWVRALVRLVESPLDHVKAAAAAGHLPLRIAVQAPGKVPVHGQVDWLGGAVFTPAAPAAPANPCRTFHGADAVVIHQARELARVCMGRDAPTGQVDAWILRHWREHVPGRALEEGRTPPPAPDRSALDFEWAAPSGELHGTAPAEALLGPWQEPASLSEALSQLEAAQAVRRGRAATLARGFALIQAHALWRQAGFASPWALAQQVLGWSRRTAWRHLELGRALTKFPQLDAAVHRGFAPRAASAIAAVSDSPAVCNRWLRLARHLGQQELERATAPASKGGRAGERLEDYERAVAIARRNAAALLGPHGPASRPSGTIAVFRVGGSNAEPAGVSSAGTSEPPLRVALPVPEPVRSDIVRGHPQLAEAARWFLAHNRLRPPSGFAAAKWRARYRCLNPECGVPSLRVEAHHAQWRQHGGDDDPANAVTLCPPCHLRLVHTRDARMRVTRVVVEDLEALLWQFSRRVPVLLFLEIPAAQAPGSSGGV